MEYSLCRNKAVTGRYTKMSKWNEETITWLNSVIDNGPVTAADVTCRACEKYIDRFQTIPKQLLKYKGMSTRVSAPDWCTFQVCSHHG